LWAARDAAMVRADRIGRMIISKVMRKIQFVTIAIGVELRPQVFGCLFLLALFVGLRFVIVFIEVLNEQSYDFRLVLR
jgi:hypothetical protein